MLPANKNFNPQATLRTIPGLPSGLSAGYPPSPYGDDVIYEQPSTQSLLLLSPIQTVEEIARSGPGACSKEEKRECWSSFSPLQLFLPLKYKVTENLEIDKLDWQPVDKTVLLL